MIEPEPISQRGVGCTQVVKFPRTSLYFLGPSLWISSPQKNASGACVPNMLWSARPSHRRRAGRVVERPGLRLEVELHPVGRNPRAAGLEHDVALRDDQVLVVERLDEVRHELHVLAVELNRDVA